jgi:RsiW-degrading membrane proteinase PrsW (M82 family)
LFDFVQWDSPLTLLLEVALSIVVLIALMWVARRVNAASVPPSKNMDHQLQHRDANTSETSKGTQETHTVEQQSNE